MSQLLWSDVAHIVLWKLEKLPILPSRMRGLSTFNRTAGSLMMLKIKLCLSFDGLSVPRASTDETICPLIANSAGISLLTSGLETAEC